MNIAITGSTGFIGNALKAYLKQHHSIIEVDLRINELDNYDFKGVDTVIHLAAIAHTKGISEELYLKINRDLAVATAKKAKADGVAQFIFMSTVKVYGDSSGKEIKFDENSICNPTDAYGKSKFEAEQLIESLSDSAFRVAIIRSPLVYGPGVKANMFNLIKLVEKLPIIPLKGINNKRSIVFIGNLISLINRMIEINAYGVFIPSDTKPLSTSEICFFIAKSMNRNVRFIKFPQFLQYIISKVLPYHHSRVFGSFIVDSKLTNSLLNFTVPFTSEFGINETVKWYMKKH